MGIQDLFTLLKKECPTVIHHVKIDVLSGISVAVDISVFFNVFVKTSTQSWLEPFIHFLLRFKKKDIYPIFIFDGLEVPEEKKGEQQHRRDTVNKSKDNLARGKELLPLVEKYQSLGEAPPPEVIEELKVIIGPKRAEKMETDFTDIYSILPSLHTAMKQLTKQTTPILPIYTSIARDFIEALGFDHYLAKGEAEALCASMCIEGKVDAVITEDSDVMAYGCPYLICKWRDGECDLIAMEDILFELGLSYESFRDLCILLKCDYNHRAKLPPSTKKRKDGEENKPRGVGMVKALELINEHQSLENIEPLLWDPEVLNYRRCRELFQPPSTSFLPPPAPRSIDKKRLAGLWKKHGLREGLYGQILGLWTPAEVVIDSDQIEF